MNKELSTEKQYEKAEEVRDALREDGVPIDDNSERKSKLKYYCEICGEETNNKRDFCDHLYGHRLEAEEDIAFVDDMSDEYGLDIGY